jgi:hypothetical protein
MDTRINSYNQKADALRQPSNQSECTFQVTTEIWRALATFSSADMVVTMREASLVRNNEDLLDAINSLEDSGDKKELTNINKHPDTSMFELYRAESEIDFRVKDSESNVAIAKDENLPFKLQVIFAEKGTNKIRMALARNPNIDSNVQLILSRFGGSNNFRRPPFVPSTPMAILASHPNLSLEVQLALAKSNDRNILYNLARRKNLARNLDLQKELANRGGARVQRELAKNRALLPDMQEEFTKQGDSSVKEELASNLIIETYIRKQLAECEDPAVYRVLARRQDLSIHEQEAFAKHKDTSVKEALAGNANLALHLQETLAMNGDSSVDRVLAKREDLEPHLRDELEAFGDFSIKRALGMTSSESDIINAACIIMPNLPKDVLSGIALLGTADALLKLKVASEVYNPTTREIVENDLYLAINDLSQDQLHDISRHPGSTIDLYKSEAGVHPVSKDYSVRQKIAMNEKVDMPVGLQMCLARSEDAVVRMELARNPNIKSEEAQRILVKDANKDVRLWMAHNPSLSEESQITLAEDLNRNVKINLVLNKNVVSETVQSKLSEDDDLIVRNTLAAQSYQLNQAVQLKLANVDQQPSTRASLARNSIISPETQRVLARDRDPNVRRALKHNRKLIPELESQQDWQPADIYAPPVGYRRAILPYNPENTIFFTNVSPEKSPIVIGSDHDTAHLSL